MNKTNRQSRHQTIRKHLVGTNERPRLAIFRSNQHIYAQIIDDAKGVTIVSESDIKLAAKKKSDKAFEVGKSVAAKARKKGITAVVFDRGGFLYHGRVKSVAEGAREGGLKF